MTNTGYIILRDVPKQEAQIDLSMYEIKGGFRGFQRLPAGPHYVSVKLSDGMREGVWCYVPPGEVVVKVLGYPDPHFNDDDPETAAHFSDLAKSGAMHAVLIGYDPDNLKTWETLTDHVGPDDFPPAFRALQEDGPGTRFERALAAHDGNVDGLLGEHQFAFVRWLVKQDDEAALKHWSDLTQAFYNAGEFGIESAPDLFGPLVETLMLQLALLPDSMLTPTSAAIYGASYLAEDLQDVDDQPLLNSKGAAFEAFLDAIG